MISVIATIGVISFNSNKSHSIKSLLMANVEALARGDEDSTTEVKTYQVGEKTITNGKKFSTTEKDWSWDVSLQIWFFKGSRSSSAPTNYTETSQSETIKLKCCRAKGPDKECSYEEC